MSQDNDSLNNPTPLPDNLGVFLGATQQTIIATDVICEGPVKGLVDGQASVFLNNDRAVPSEQAPAFHSEEQSAIQVRLTNGSNVAVVQGGTEELFDRAETNAGDRYLHVFDVIDPIQITISPYEGQGLGAIGKYITPMVNAGEAYHFKNATSTIPGHAYTTTPGGAADDAHWSKFKPARLVARATVNGESSRRTISGWIRSYSYNSASDSTKGFFIPGVGGTRTGGYIEDGDYDLHIDKILPQTGSIVFPNLYMLGSWAYTTGDYNFNLTSGLVNDAPNLDDSLITNFRGVQTQFRAGNLTQVPLTGGGQTTSGEGNVAISNSPGVAINQTDSFGGSQAPIEVQASSSTGFNLTATQIPEVDIAKITFNYPALYAMDGEGKTKNTAVFYKVELALKRPNQANFDTAILLQDDHRHVGKSKNSLSYQIRHDMSQYESFVDFKFIISRKTSESGDGYDHLGNQKGGWSNISNATIATTTAIINERLSHPYTAMSRIAWHTSDFQNNPKRSYHMRGLMVRVPSNYITREELSSNQALYTRNVSTGVKESTYQDWDGNFRPTLVYTNNPAWVFYDILLNNRYGLGQFLADADIDKFQLYRIARYCDELVDDGTGTLEPRFTANLFLSKQTDAYKVLKDMLTIFRGMLYFIDGQVMPQFDAPTGPVYNFSKANVLDGAFSYEGTGSKTRINQVMVTWNNPDKNYEPEPLLVEDRANIVKTGKIISQDSVAFGCTSEGQALRYGRWKLWTAANQTEIVSFATGLNGSYLRPGDVVNIQDSDKAGIRYSGRIGSNVEAGLNVSHTHAPAATGGQIASNGDGFDATDRTNNVVMAGEAILPSSFSQDECLFEYGATGQGVWIGVREISSEYKFVYRTGDGGTSTTATDTHSIIGEIPVDEIPEFDGGSHTIAWEIQPDNGEAYLWIDGRLVFELETTDGSNLDSGVWAGSNVGGWGQGFGATAGDYALTAWSGAIQSDLRVYNSQITTDKITLDSPVTLNATSTYKLSVAYVKPAGFLAQDSATISSVSYSRGDLLSFVDTEAESYNTKDDSNDPVQITWSEYLKVEQQTISNNGNDLSFLTTSSAFENVPQRSHIWTIEEVDNSGDTVSTGEVPYRILSINEESPEKYEITAVRYYDSKFDAIENDFTTFVADTTVPDILPTSIVPKPVNVYLDTNFELGDRGATVTVHWETPVNQGTDNEYEHLSGFLIDVDGVPNLSFMGLSYYPRRVGKNVRTFDIPNVPEGDIHVTVRTINVLDNRSEAVTATTTVTQEDLTPVERGPKGVIMGGIINKGITGLRGGTFAIHNSPYKFRASTRADEITVASGTNNTQQSFANIPVRVPSADGYGFDHDAFYILFDASDTSHHLKLAKFHKDTYVSFWYDAGTGNGGKFTSNLTGTITKVAGKSLVSGSGTSFTTELAVGDVLVKADDTVLGYVASISSNTSLHLDNSSPLSASNSAFKKQNLQIDTGKDALIARVTRSDTNTYGVKPWAAVAPSLFTDQGKRTTGLSHYWPLNSIQSGKLIDTVGSVAATSFGTAGTTSTDSPVGKSLQNNDGIQILTASAAQTLETGSSGFAYSTWFKSESKSGSANARIIDRDFDGKYAVVVDQSEGADDVQDLKLYVVGSSNTTFTNLVTYDEWHNLIVSFDGTNLQVFFDGEEIYTESGYDPAAADKPVQVGVNDAGSGNKFIGKFTEIKAYNRSLTLEEAYAEFNNPAATTAPIVEQELQIGTDDGDIFKVTSDGIALGNTTFNSAPFRVDMAGNLTATSATITGAITATSGTFTGAVTAESFIEGKPVPEVLEETAINRNAMMAPRVAMKAGTCQFGILEDDTTIYKNDEVVKLTQSQGTRNNFSVAQGDILHSNKPCSLQLNQGPLPSLSQTGTEFTSVSGASPQDQNYHIYSPYGATRVRYFVSAGTKVPTKTPTNGGTLIDWTDHNEFDKVHNATELLANYRYEIVATGTTDFTAIGAADSNPGTQFDASGAGSGSGTAKIVEGWKNLVPDASSSVMIPDSTVTEVSITASTSQTSYWWIKSDMPILIYRNSNGTDHTNIRPVSREIFTYDGLVEVKFDPSQTKNSTTKQVSDWRYTRNTDVKLGSFDNGDGGGADGTSHFPWSHAGDTYCILHSLSGYQLATIEPSIINAYYWSGSAWVLHKSHDFSAASRENFQGVKEGVDDDGGNSLASGANIWRFNGTGRFVLRANSYSPLPNHDEYFALGYDSNLRLENTIRAGKIIAGDIAADSITANAIAANAVTADAIQAGEIAVTKLTGDISDVYPINYPSAIGQATMGGTKDNDVNITLPAPTGGVSKRGGVVLTVSLSATNNHSSADPVEASADVILEKMSKGQTTGTSLGTVTAVVTQGSFKRVQFVRTTANSSLPSIGSVSRSASAGSGFPATPVKGYHSSTQNTAYGTGSFTYVYVDSSFSVSVGDTLYFNPDAWESSGTYVPSGNYHRINISVPNGETVSEEVSITEQFGEGTTEYNFRVTLAQVEAGQSATPITVHRVQGRMEQLT